MSKNILNKTADIETPYAVFKGNGPFGDTEVRLLKTYQKPDNELSNPYARWMVAARSDMTFGSWEYGDSYIHEAVYNLHLTDASDKFKEQYYASLEYLAQKGRFTYGK